MSAKILQFPTPKPAEDHSVRAMLEMLRQARLKLNN